MAPAETPNTLFQRPEKECDLIMKGGITSGVVYPPAILKLAETYRFRSIGGTSAGAIAAAAAAAAELGREQALPGAGFAGLRLMQQELSQPGFLLKLLQPSRKTRPLYEAGLLLKEKLEERAKHPPPPPPEAPGTWARSVRWLREARDMGQPILEASAGAAFHRGRILGGLVGAALSALLLWPAITLLWVGSPGLQGVAGVWILVLLTVLCWAFATAGGFLQGGRFLAECLKAVTDKEQGFYGMCSGMSDGSAPQPSGGTNLALTEWLTRRINELAGRGASQQPLTMGDLKKAQHPITLEMVTTNLSHRQPYSLPMKDGAYVFSLDDMRRLFPQPVVDHLVSWSQGIDAKAGAERTVLLPPGYYHFPVKQDLPVVVATRMSLSFPLLLSAVRLYTIKNEAYAKGSRAQPYQLQPGDLDENWFSDGGIASNFPIHKFDAWLPSRPTFGITLTDSPLPRVKSIEHGSPLQEDPGSPSVYLPRPRDAQNARPRPVPVPNIVSFMAALFDSASSFRDNTQAWLPSYRERVAHVFLAGNEGGLNLTMPPEVIRGIEAKGVLAAEKFLQFDFEEHRWVRLRVLLAQLEKEFSRIGARHPDKTGDELKQHLRAHYQQLLEAQLSASPRWYKPEDKAWCEQAVERISLLMNLISDWKSLQQEWERTHPRQTGFFSHNPPKPEGILRVTPEL